MIAQNLLSALALAGTISASPAFRARSDPCQDAYQKCIAAGTPQVACSCTLSACLGEDNARNREFCATATASLSTAPTTTPAATTPAATTPAAAAPAATTTAVAAPAAAPGSNPKVVAGKTWTLHDLTRYCGEKNDGCDYNFSIEADGKTEHCTVVRMPGSNAATESWSNQPCDTGSDYSVSWGYVANPAPAFAAITVVNNKSGELAWFGASNINGQAVTPSSPFGSGQYGNAGPEPVYTYKN